jgi:23S rRNA-/tRNA-specific pseudouridylate synthase
LYHWLTRKHFVVAVIKKTYTAIVMGIPTEASETAISSEAAYDMGVDVDPKDDELWQHIDFTLEEKSAVTMWKALKYAKSLRAKDQILTMVELKPKTGRYHQLRRHMAWVCDSPIIGDGEYDGGTEYTMCFRERGLFLCSNRISLEHPFFNSEYGRPIWETLDEEEKYGKNIWLSESNRVMVSASIELPDKFENLLAREEERFHKFGGDEPSQ